MIKNVPNDAVMWQFYLHFAAPQNRNCAQNEIDRNCTVVNHDWDWELKFASTERTMHSINELTHVQEIYELIIITCQMEGLVFAYFYILQ